METFAASPLRPRDRPAEGFHGLAPVEEPRFIFNLFFNGLLAVACMALAFGCQARLLNANDETLSQELTVSPDEVDFGKLRIGEVVSRTIDIRNRGSRTLHILEPDRNCGCTRSKLGAMQLAPGESTTLELELTAPMSPALVMKRVSLACRESPDAKRPIVVRGEVAASLWAEPGIVQLEVPRGGTATASVVLRHVPGVRIARAESDVAAMSVETNVAGEAACEVTLRIDGAALGAHELVDGHLAVFLDADMTPALRVPVRWQARSKLRFAPRTLTVLPGCDKLQRTVTLLLDTDMPAEPLDITALVPGVEVVSRRTQGKRVILRLALDTERLSPGRHVAIRARSHDGEEQDELTIECGPRA